MASNLAAVAAAAAHTLSYCRQEHSSQVAANMEKDLGLASSSYEVVVVAHNIPAPLVAQDNTSVLP